jgi:hypothetical protein
MEKISREAGDEDAWICRCGNMPHQDGFYPCDITGREIEPDANSAWDGLYVCAACGAIIYHPTLEIRGQATAVTMQLNRES